MGFPDCAVVRSGDQYIMGAAVKQTLMLITGRCRIAAARLAYELFNRHRRGIR
jgi:urease accessory protein UreE